MRRWTAGIWCEAGEPRKLKSCGVSFLDAPEEIFATVLNYLGKDPNSSKADDYTGPATDLLLEAAAEHSLLPLFAIY